jgi:hypothetical protein
MLRRASPISVDDMSNEADIRDEQLARYRSLVSDIQSPPKEVDDAIMLVGLIMQSVIDRAFGRDSVQLAVSFNQKSSSQADSIGAILRKPKKQRKISTPRALIVEPQV